MNDEDAENLDKLLKVIDEHIIDPTQDSHVKTVDFVQWFDPVEIVDVLTLSYSNEKKL